jgi:glycosyltransferase involved in cell wall biosynthesis
MRFSVIATVYNEEKSIVGFLESITKQSRRPDEFIIVDGGSKDKTVEKIKEFSRRHDWIKVFVKKGANISQGRNLAIKKARNEYVVGADAGCRMEKNNLKNITKPFEEGYDVVSGNWKPTYDNIKQEAMARVLYPDLDSPITKKRFLPSSRNIAFKKSCWKKVGGYPENLYTGEDTLFNLKLKEIGCRFHLAKNAIVYWKMREDYRKFWKQFYLYGKGDKKAGNLSNFRLNGMLNLFMVMGFWAWLLLSLITFFLGNPYFLLVFPLALIYFFSGGIRTAKKSGKIAMLYYGSVAFLIKRVAYVTGATFS